MTVHELTDDRAPESVEQHRARAAVSPAVLAPGFADPAAWLIIAAIIATVAGLAVITIAAGM